ncbi:MAG: hypothetical protein A3I61_03910 [Acidobacteria bacterium RIFCSPLOWO2_02_FULL_68_18]|nr:MAG: hypothetical protein A3I61_03910 [Acidobacteria bacterium RIFCSPLOWO2_02_FULL_68_18]OFW48812.1 MAG: hypothetical protein A3G77_17845 [Acidobacteria bacterium RIFCSPLOWO2_12_FULL_68_19]
MKKVKKRAGARKTSTRGGTRKRAAARKGGARTRKVARKVARKSARKTRTRAAGRKTAPRRRAAPRAASRARTGGARKSEQPLTTLVGDASSQGGALGGGDLDSIGGVTEDLFAGAEPREGGDIGDEEDRPH